MGSQQRQQQPAEDLGELRKLGREQLLRRLMLVREELTLAGIRRSKVLPGLVGKNLDPNANPNDYDRVVTEYRMMANGVDAGPEIQRVKTALKEKGEGSPFLAAMSLATKIIQERGLREDDIRYHIMVNGTPTADMAMRAYTEQTQGQLGDPK